MPNNDSGKQAGFVLLVIILILMAICFAGVLYWISQVYAPDQAEKRPQLAFAVSPTPAAVLKTYTNNQYGFEITYPRLGVIVTPYGFEEGECGKVIREKDLEILFDNFFTINIIKTTQTLDEFITSKGAANKYDLEKIVSTNADEAVSFKGLKKGVEYAVGFPPMAYTAALYKKGEIILQILSIQNPGNFGGCLNPDLIDPVKYGKYKKMDWKLENNLKFKSI